MAGIGFELKRALSRGRLSDILQVAISGILIVAGPWIFSIISITLVQRFARGTLGEGLDLFIAVMVYSYAFSLILFSGFHFIFTRTVADLLYEKKTGQGLYTMLVLLIPFNAASLVISGAAAVFLQLPATVSYPLLFKFSMVLLFLSINLIWVIMVFLSLLKWYARILIVYAGGMGFAFLLIVYLSTGFGTAGALLGFAVGHALIAGLLCFIILLEEKPVRIEKVFFTFFSSLKKNHLLFFTGLFLYAGAWIDKVVFWIGFGAPVSGTFFRLFESYDIAVYYANLGMIPGLAFFVIFTETQYYVYLRKFILALVNKPLQVIRRQHYKLTTQVRRALLEQTLFHGVCSVCIVLTAQYFIRFFVYKVPLPVFALSVGAVFFHLLMFTLINFLFYTEHYGFTLFVSLCFFAVNLILAIITAAGGLELWTGLSYGASAAGASIIGIFLFAEVLKKVDRYILAPKHTS
ncbi:MAG: exopolysaccharide Pel transporter PelG [Spirochaetia bacterium]